MTAFSSVAHKDLPSDSKLPPHFSSESSEIRKRLTEINASTAEILKKIAVNGKEAAYLFKLSGCDYNTMRYNLNRIEFALNKGLKPEYIKEVATGPDGTFHDKTYALLLLISDAEMKIPDYLMRSGITGTKIKGALERGFGGDINYMYQTIIKAMAFEAKEARMPISPRTEG
ncbi:MAG: hypothetical protein KGH66_00120 [Candidatus Micrarchaeota archaeon]|nr:hypothetical protein [Candidatus Micrarchaeota archaeon]